jgi:hypothetical protein
MQHMGRHKTIDDAAMRVLLEPYHRPGLDDATLESLFARAKAAKTSAAAPALAIPPRRFVGAAARVSMAAGLILALGLGCPALLRQGELASPYAVLQKDGAEAMVSREGVVEAVDGDLRLRTASESLVLADHGRLRIGSDPWRRLTGDTGNRYILDSGQLYIDHSAAAGIGGFSLVLPWGTARPLGTILSCRVDERGAELYCLSGALRFVAPKGRHYVIAEGRVLRIRDEGRAMDLEATAPGESPFRPASLEQGAATEASPGASPPAPASQVSANPGATAKPALASSWTRELGALPIEIFADEKWTIVVFPKEILVLDQGDGRVIAKTMLDAAIGACARQGDRLFLYAKAGLRAVNLPGLGEAWAMATGNMAFTSFSLAGDRLYLPSAEGKLYIHDQGDGHLVGSIETGIGLYGRPLVADGRIIVSALDQRILAYRQSDHEKLWEHKADGRLVDDRPLAIGDRIVDYTTEGGIFALDARSGELLWKVPAASAIVEPPRIWNSSLIYRDGAGAHNLSFDGIERGGQGDSEEWPSSEQALLTKSFGGTIIRVDPEYRLTLYRKKP